jgi:S-methylmethionine-dependent homocysteine/selenocysteine methylase
MHHRQGRSSATNYQEKVATMMPQAAMVVGGCCRTLLLHLGRAPC